MNKNGTTRASQAGGKGGRQTTWMIIGAAVVLIASVAVGLRMRGTGPTASAPTSAGPGQAYSVPPGNATGVPLAPYTGGARMAADVTQLDFGQKQYLEPVDAQFTVRNVGDAPLLIADVTAKAVAGCWPPKAVVGSTTIAPGGQTTISAQFSMHEGMGGPHQFDLHVKTNDEVQPEQVLTILAEFPLP